jgi:hypothetical protein
MYFSNGVSHPVKKANGLHDILLAFSRDIRDKIIQNLDQEMHLKKEEVVSKGLQANSLSDSKSKTYKYTVSHSFEI